MKRITTFLQACKALSIDSALPTFPALSKEEQKAMIAHYKLCIIAKALNGDWIADWDDSSQWKYYPWFNMRTGAFSCCVYDYRYQGSIVGSRLCFRDRETAEYAGTQFTTLYQDYFLISKK